MRATVAALFFPDGFFVRHEIPEALPRHVQLGLEVRRAR